MTVPRTRVASNATSAASACPKPLSEADVRRIIREEMSREALASVRRLSGEIDHFSTQGGDRYAPPEYRGRAKRWRADAPTIPGSVRVGRWTTVSRAAYSLWIASKASTPSPAPVAVVAAWNPLDTFASLRAVGGKK